MDGKQGVNDREILEMVSKIGEKAPVIIGVDAPLSYNQGGGNRPSDRELLQLVLQHGGGVGVMAPTFRHMAYLTLRGVAVTRMLEALSLLPRQLRIVEVHPGAAMLLRGAPAEEVRTYKRKAEARPKLLEWLAKQGMQGLQDATEVSDHWVDACAAALAAWRWAEGSPAWCYRAQPPEHPYDFAC